MQPNPFARISFHSFIDTLLERILSHGIVRNSSRISAAKQTQAEGHFFVINSFQLNVLWVI